MAREIKNVLRVKWGSIPKTLITKYTVELKYLAVELRPHEMSILRLLGRPYTLLYVSRSVCRLYKTLDSEEREEQ